MKWTLNQKFFGDLERFNFNLQRELLHKKVASVLVSKHLAHYNDKAIPRHRKVIRLQSFDPQLAATPFQIRFQCVASTVSSG